MNIGFACFALASHAFPHGALPKQHLVLFGCTCCTVPRFVVCKVLGKSDSMKSETSLPCYIMLTPFEGVDCFSVAHDGSYCSEAGA